MSNKNKHTIWLPDSTWQKVEDYYRTDNCAAKNEFIKKAIEFYVGSLHTKNANAFLPEVLSTTLTGTLDEPHQFSAFQAGRGHQPDGTDYRLRHRHR